MSTTCMAHKSPFYLDESRPFAQRNATMTLDIVRPHDIPRGVIMYCKDEDRSLKTQDIHTAQPTYNHLKYLSKPDLAVGSTDPEHVGCRARTYYPPMDRRVRDLNLTTADIELAQPRSHKHKGNRHVDPVCPNYQMPSSYQREHTPPRFNGRHTNDVSDIDLACPRKLIPDRNYVRDPNDCRDIEFASANYQERLNRRASRGPRQDRTHDVRDITGTKRINTRCTNPLDPEYSVPTHATTSLHHIFSEEKATGGEAPREANKIGTVAGSKPRKLQWDNGEPQFSLLREDMAGTVPQRWVGSVPSNIYDPPEVRPMISFHDPHDIPGAQVGSLRKGIEGITRRQCNPLNPRYPMLDCDVRPQPMPLLENERGNPKAGLGAHPMLQSRMLSSTSAPDLRRQTPQGAHSQLQRGHSSTNLAPHHMMGATGGRPPSGAMTPSQAYRVGDTLRMDESAFNPQMMSHRSGASGGMVSQR
eukprot:TRINITY_DN10733_c0_g1_i1.p1 TRINITY_DN10733_c0_g1~~TRINITY_DN10733_c0_g1_i1.p1  ORF type:complete len:473 (-),score=46.48 TRINITY_DN10733_c0_g1_i1:439-1857(-)